MKKLALVILIVPGLAFVGCTLPRATFTYSPSEKVVSELKNAPLPLKVAVMPLQDMRSQDNADYRNLALIPLVPYGTMSFNRPDAVKQKQGFHSYVTYSFRPSEDFAKAVVAEMKQNNFFKEVFYTEAEREAGVDLVVTGKIVNTYYSGAVITYGLSVFGTFLWYTGLPVGTTHNSILLSLEMRRTSDDVAVWSHEVKGEWDKTIGLYYNAHADLDGYPLILREGLHKGMEKLANQLRTQDLSYWIGNK